jgi:hypothetical protein
MPHPLLDVPDVVARVALIPGAVERLGGSPELHHEIAGEVLGVGLAAFLAPKAQQSSFILAHNDAGIRSADESPAALIHIRVHASELREWFSLLTMARKMPYGIT